MELPGKSFYVNKKIAKQLKSNDTALVLSYLRELQHRNKGIEFDIKQQQLAQECNLTVPTLRTCINKLINAKYIEVVKKGIPARNFYIVLI